MTRGPGAPARPRRRAVSGGLAVAVLVCAGLLVSAGPRPLEPTSDLYTHLSVARHLVRGEGFRTDIAYPLSFAWPFARELPQPLLHRAPGYGLLLAAPVAATGDDPQRGPAAARALQVVLLGALAWLGSAAWFARGRPGAAVGWAVLLAAHPLTAYAVDWGHDELPAALMLLAWWLRHRDGARTLRAADGLLLGGLALLRPELLWLPLLWWLLRRPARPALRPLLACALAFALLAGPWAARNLRLAGDPFFSLQAHAEHLKDTRAFPGYTVYRQLTPQPLLRTLAADPVPVARKAWRGLRFFWSEQRALLPPLAVPALLLLGAELLRRRTAALVRRRPPGAEPALLALGGPLGLGLLTAAGLYAVFDHSVRHFEALLPVLLWESGPLLAEVPCRWLRDRIRGRDGGAPDPWCAAAVAGVAGLAVALLAVRPPLGWDQAEAAARRATGQVVRETDRLLGAPPGVVFVTTAAAPWFADRSAVWDPGEEGLRRRIASLVEAAP